MPIGKMNMMREMAVNVRTQFVGAIVCNAVFEMDVDAMAQIVERIDGLVPAEGERDNYANILGDALEQVLALPVGPQACVYEDDPAIIAIAKVLVYISMQPCGNNQAKRKSRARAIEMVLKRVGGKKTEPVREALTVDYVQPEWMQGLPQGGK